MSISNWNQGFFSTSIFGYKRFGKLSPPKKLAKFVSPINTKNGNFVFAKLGIERMNAPIVEKNGNKN
jgi:hypothetical protein